MAGRTLVGALRVTLGLDSTQFTTGVRTAQESMRRLGGQLQRIGAVASLAGAGVAAAIRGQLNAADEMGKMAQRFGVGVEQLSSLKHAADMSGVSMEQLGAGLQQMSRNAVQSAHKFEALGVSVRDANGVMRPTSEVLEDVAQVLADMPNGAEKTAAAMQIFGRSGAQLLPMLNLGRDGIRAMTEEARAMGLVISEDTARSAEAFNDNLNRLYGTMRGVWVQITAALAPVLERLSEFAVQASRAFQNLSPEMQTFAAVAAALTVVIGPILVGLGMLISLLSFVSAPVAAVVAVIIGATAAFAAFKDELAAVPGNLAIILDYYFPGLRDRAAELGRGILNLTQNLVAIHVQGFQYLVGQIPVVIEGFRNLGQSMRDMASGAVDFVRTKIEELLVFLREVPGRVVEIGRNIAQGLADGIRSSWNSVVSAIRKGSSQAVDTFREDWMVQSPSRVTAEIGRFISEGLAVGITEGQAGVANAMAGLTDVAMTASSGLQKVGGQLTDMFASAFSSILTGSQSAGDAISSLLRQLAQMAANAAFKQLFSGIFGGGMGRGLGQFLGINAYAGGTMSARRGLAVVGEQGPELVSFRGGERVYNARETQGIMSGSGETQVNLTNVNVLDPAIVGQFLSRADGRRVLVNALRQEGIIGA